MCDKGLKKMIKKFGKKFFFKRNPTETQTIASMSVENITTTLQKGKNCDA